MSNKAEQQAVELLKRWRNDPVAFVEEGLGLNPVNHMSITSQQRELLNICGKLVHAKKKCYDERKKVPGKNWKISDEERELDKKIGVSIMSGKGTGKDCSSSWIILWFLFCFPRAKIACCAPTQDQLKKNLWAEVAKWASMVSPVTKEKMMQPFLTNNLRIESEKIYLKNTGDGASKDGQQWFAFMKTPQKQVDKEQMKSTLSGIHEDNLLFIIDEAAGIEDAVFEPLENTLSDRINWVLILFNPSKNNGYAHSTHFGIHSDKYVRLHWDAEESDRVDKRHILRMEELYGRDSDNFRVNVKGLPPRGDDDALIPHQWIYEAVNRDISVDPSTGAIFGVDVAGSGKDTTIITVRQGHKVLEQIKINEIDSLEQASRIMDYVEMYRSEKDIEIVGICIDAIAVGKGVYDSLRRMFSQTHSVIASASSSRDDFRRKRDELWWRLRTCFEKGMIDIPNDISLREELSIIKYRTESGKTIVESKDSIIKRLGRSPDRADSLMLSYYLHDAYMLKPVSEKRRYKRENRRGGTTRYDADSRSFMLA